MVVLGPYRTGEAFARFGRGVDEAMGEEVFEGGAVVPSFAFQFVFTAPGNEAVAERGCGERQGMGTTVIGQVQGHAPARAPTEVVGQRAMGEVIMSSLQADTMPPRIAELAVAYRGKAMA